MARAGCAGRYQARGGVGAGHRPALVLLRTRVDYDFMERIGYVVVSALTAPLWVPGYVLTVGMRWVLGRDQSNDSP